MPISHQNRRGDTYYLHVGTTAAGKSRYFFAKERAEGNLAESIPEGYELYESPGAQVFLRRCLPQHFTDEEIGNVRSEMQRSPARHWLLDLKKCDLIVYTAEEPEFLECDAAMARLGSRARELFSSDRYLNYHAVMRFVLTDSARRTFRVDRWCFRGRIDGWISLAEGYLPELAAEYCPYLGTDDFYELIGIPVSP